MSENENITFIITWLNIILLYCMFDRLTGRGLMVLGPLMQLCWCFSLLAVNEDSNIFQYTFAALNVGQVGTSPEYNSLYYFL